MASPIFEGAPSHLCSRGELNEATPDVDHPPLQAEASEKNKATEQPGRTEGVWEIPVAGNCFRTEPSPGHNGVGADQILLVNALEPTPTYSVFFRLDRPAKVELELTGRLASDVRNNQAGDRPNASSPDQARTGQLKISVYDDAQQPLDGRPQSVAIDSADWESCSLGVYDVSRAGYLRVDLSSASLPVKIKNLTVRSSAPGLVVDFVRNNEGNMYYWGRRGPSVHLSYSLPQERSIRFGYSEITVPQGSDPIGSYFMANGFGEGYFGIQVNEVKERRILFSIWSPFSTDNPAEIPADQKIELIAKGDDVQVGEFGNEGSGGQSFRVFPWKSGKTYAFLTEVVPENDNQTRYTSWFAERRADRPLAAGDWMLIASFRRPQTSTYLTRFHSFLENFNPSYGHIERTAMHGNVWTCDTEGVWQECLQARFSVDATGGGGHRKDFMGGSNASRFFMRNGGFFAHPTEPGDRFTRDPSGEKHPAIEFDLLPR